jgi:type IV pilus assembly protein PilW
MTRLQTTSGRRHSRGVSLIELMVALTIGLVLLGGTLAMYMKARDIYSTNDTVSRLQENARYAMDLVESDVRMANYWGLMSRSLFITNSACTPSATTVSVSGTCGATTSCPGGGTGTDWSFDADNYIDGLDGVTATAALKTATSTLACSAKDGSGNDGKAVAGTDVLVVRRASSDLLAPAAAPAANTVYIASTRTSAELFTDTVPAGYSSLGVTAPPRYEVRPFVTSVYYISQDSVGRAGFPALRRKQLGSGPRLTDQEMLSGVEDLQLLFGWDTAGQDQRADVYLPPGTRPTAGSIVAVQVCMVVRSDVLDLAMQNANYTDCRGNAVASGNQRRMLISRTVQVRNRRS